MLKCGVEELYCKVSVATLCSVLATFLQNCVLAVSVKISNSATAVSKLHPMNTHHFQYLKKKKKNSNLLVQQVVQYSINLIQQHASAE